MAQIRTVFTLTDNVSPALLKMSNAAEIFNSKLNGMNGVLGDIPSILDDTSTKTNRLNRDMVKLVRTLVGLSSAIAIISNISTVISVWIGRINALVREYEDAIQSEKLLTSVMRQRMNATDAMVDSVLELANAMEKNGIYEADMITMGAQELATYVSNKEALEQLIPAMINLVAQRQGFVATSQDFVSAATMMGKVIQGQTTALTRYGYIFDATEEKLLKTGNEMQRAASLYDIIIQNIGNPYAGLTNTEIGSIMQAGNRINAVKESFGEAFAGIKRQLMTFKADIYEYFEDPIVNAVGVIEEKLGGMVRMLLTVGSIAVAVGAMMGAAWLVANPPILAIVAAISMVIKIFSELSGSISGAMSTAMGAISGFAGFVTGVFNTVYNAIAVVWNAMASVVQLIVDVIQGLTGATTITSAILSFILNIARTVVNVISGIIGFIELFTGSNISDKLNEFSDKLGQMSDALYKGEENRIVVQRMEPEGMGDRSIRDYVGRGMQFGESLSESIDNAFNPKKFDDVLPKGANGAIRTEDANAVELVDEMKDLLARRALEQYIVRVSQVTPQITFENINIAETADADMILDNIAAALDESSNSYLGTGVAGGTAIVG